ncbi:MAG TPA: hypothetical protein VI409_03065 [Gaiellaceae bacterium]|nr:hypothetical protein [Gaiellaceae bacterium]
MQTTTGSTARERYVELTTGSRTLWERALESLPGAGTGSGLPRSTQEFQPRGARGRVVARAS